ncbi:MAG: DUF2383 domain-containing protein [Nitrospiraceae bacterium]|nr:DUF2383 domain-containing protein [Nitrospiraceae bacterium]
MDTKEMAKKLSNLVKLDIDAVHAYTKAIEHIDVPEVKHTLEGFMGDHERHIKNLSEQVRLLGETAPGLTKDFKGYLIEGFTAIRSRDTESALKAMKTNEQLTNRIYASALKEKEAYPTNIMAILDLNYSDEQRHLSYIQTAINDRIWEKARAGR